MLTENRNVFKIDKLINQCIELLDNRNQYHFIKDVPSSLIAVNKVALQQIFLNLIGNAIKYNNKTEVEIKISFTEEEQYYNFKIKDNGLGIEEKN
jgi:hypothetical protein